MRFLLTLLALSILTDCNQPSSTPKTQSKPETATNAPVTFQFSKKAAIQNLYDEKSWCNGAFIDATLINADPANNNRRFFQMEAGAYRVAVQLGNATSSFYLKKADAKSIDIFTSDNFPMCASNRVNFSLAGEGSWFKYDNAHGISYTVEAQPTENGTFIIIEFSGEISYGLTVHHCADCR